MALLDERNGMENEKTDEALADPVLPSDAAEMKDAALPALPVEPADPAEPILAILPTDAIDPALPVDPALPADPVLPVDPALPADPADPALPADPVLPVDPALPAEPAGADEDKVDGSTQLPVPSHTRGDKHWNTAVLLHRPLIQRVAWHVAELKQSNVVVHVVGADDPPEAEEPPDPALLATPDEAPLQLPR